MLSSLKDLVFGKPSTDHLGGLVYIKYTLCKAHEPIAARYTEFRTWKFSKGDFGSPPFRQINQGD